jgi:hypothetical protein
LFNSYSDRKKMRKRRHYLSDLSRTFTSSSSGIMDAANSISPFLRKWNSSCNYPDFALTKFPLFAWASMRRA